MRMCQRGSLSRFGRTQTRLIFSVPCPFLSSSKVLARSDSKEWQDVVPCTRCSLAPAEEHEAVLRKKLGILSGRVPVDLRRSGHRRN